jgi:hypothetical protein
LVGKYRDDSGKKNSWNHLHRLSKSPFLTCSDHVLQRSEIIFSRIVRFKRPENLSNFKMKNTIDNGMKMFWKYQLTVCRSIQNFYSHFTRVTRPCPATFGNYFFEENISNHLNNWNNQS